MVDGVAAAGGCHAQHLAGQHQAGLPCAPGGALQLSLQSPPCRSGRARIHGLLRREGWLVNTKRIYRLYKEMGLQLRKKPPKRRVKARLREGRSAASSTNEVWSMDFVHDQLPRGRKCAS
jgi:transposase InsO family protein